MRRVTRVLAGLFHASSDAGRGCDKGFAIAALKNSVVFKIVTFARRLQQGARECLRKHRPGRQGKGLVVRCECSPSGAVWAKPCRAVVLLSAVVALRVADMET